MNGTGLYLAPQNGGYIGFWPVQQAVRTGASRSTTCSRRTSSAPHAKESTRLSQQTGRWPSCRCMHATRSSCSLRHLRTSAVAQNGYYHTILSYGEKNGNAHGLAPVPCFLRPSSRGRSHHGCLDGCKRVIISLLGGA